MLGGALRPLGEPCAAPQEASAARLAPGGFDLSLLRVAANVSRAVGRSLYEFVGSACEGYTTNVRQLPR